MVWMLSRVVKRRCSSGVVERKEKWELVVVEQEESRCFPDKGERGVRCVKCVCSVVRLACVSVMGASGGFWGQVTGIKCNPISTLQLPLTLS